MVLSFEYKRKLVFSVCLSIGVFMCLFSCASKVPVLGYSETVSDAIRSKITPLSDYSDSENVNGFLPDKIYIKTATQTFCTDYEFCVIDGRIYVKCLHPEKESSTTRKTMKTVGSEELNGWSLLGGTGLPFSKNKAFNTPKRIVEISADDDSLMVFSDEGRMYQYYFVKSIIQPADIWEDTFGWPEKLPLVQNSLVSDKRGWAVATRRSKVLWYEDVYGNQHHYGTMGLDTLYFLTKDGQNIRFTDSGLPAEFSHSFLGPERGSFIARNISVSASTMFLINDAGEMYTRLADFDTIGCDPMFFKYTYKQEKQQYTGDNYLSNYTEWALPSEDWKKHSQIKLEGKARLSRFITILQNGQGNYARELRVAGYSPEGKPGYYFKQLADENWQFAEVNLLIDESNLLPVIADTVNVAKRTDNTGNFVTTTELDNTIETTNTNETLNISKRGKKQEISYSGNLWENNIRNQLVNFSIDDFPMSEGSCHLRISRGDESKTILLYPVEMWTHLYRNNPGFDGTLKNFFITYSLPHDLYDGISEEFAILLKRLFDGKDLSLFTARASAGKDYFVLTDKDSSGKEITMLLTSRENMNVEALILSFMNQYAYPELGNYLSSRLINESIYTIRDRSLIENVIALNLKYIEELQGELATYEAYKKDASVSRWGYKAFDLVTSVTLLNKIDFPKIKTMTTYGSDLMDTAADSWITVSDLHKWTYSHVIELLQNRVKQYQTLIDAFNNNHLNATVDSDLCDTFDEYFSRVNFPKSLNGKAGALAGHNVVMRRIDELPLFPGIILEANLEDSTASFLLEFKKMTETIIKRDSTDLKEEPFVIKAQVHILNDTSGKNAVTRLEGKTVKLEWDGENLTIREGFLPFKFTELFANE